VTSTIIGARTLAQLEDNLSALSFSLSKEHLDRLTQASQPPPIFPNSFIQSPLIKMVADGGCNIHRL